MKEMEALDKHVGKIHKKFMDKPRTPNESMVADLQFSANLVKMGLWNLQRWSKTTRQPKKAWRTVLTKIINEHKEEDKKA